MNSLLINGFGRIGRAIIRLICESEEFYDIKVDKIYINDPFLDLEQTIYFLKYDSIYGKFNKLILKSENGFSIDTGRRTLNIIKYSVENYNSLNITEEDLIIIDSSGIKNPCYNARAFISTNKNCKYVLITNWINDVDFVMINGYNEAKFERNNHRVISTGTCDTSAVLPVLKKLLNTYNINALSLIMLHPWLNYQNLLDNQCKMDGNSSCNQLGRASTFSIIPKGTSLYSILCNEFKNIQNNIQVMSYRVPTSSVAMADITFFTDSKIEKENLINIFLDLKDFIKVDNEARVSIDYLKTDMASEIDSNWISVGDNYGHLIVYYDNEWGYANQVLKTTKKLFDSLK